VTLKSIHCETVLSTDLYGHQYTSGDHPSYQAGFRCTLLQCINKVG